MKVQRHAMQAILNAIYPPEPESCLLSLLFPCQNHFFSFVSPSLKLLLGMPTFVLLTPLDTLELLTLDLGSLLHNLGYVAMPLDAADLGHVPVALRQGLVVLEGLAVAGGLDAFSLRGIRPPDSDVAVVGPRQDILGVGGPFDREHALHTLGVVHVSRVAPVPAPKAHGSVPGCGDQLLASGRELDIHDGGHVILENVESPVHLAHVEKVDVVVFRGGDEVERLHGGPGDAVGREGEDGFGDWGGRAEIVDD